MSYIRAEDVLPEELIKTIQQYVSGQNIYIPSVEKLNWGSRTKTKQYCIKRNIEICKKHKEGIPTSELAEEYFLSVKSIQRIIRTTDKEEKFI